MHLISLERVEQKRAAIQKQREAAAMEQFRRALRERFPGPPRTNAGVDCERIRELVLTRVRPRQGISLTDLGTVYGDLVVAIQKHPALASDELFHETLSALFPDELPREAWQFYRLIGPKIEFQLQMDEKQMVEAFPLLCVWPWYQPWVLASLARELTTRFMQTRSPAHHEALFFVYFHAGQTYFAFRNDVREQAARVYDFRNAAFWRRAQRSTRQKP